MEIQMERKEGTCASVGKYGQDTVALPKETGRNGENKHCPAASTTKQARETQEKWNWVEPNVWTGRMLAALEEGVKGNVWFSLIDKVYSENNLRSAWKKVQANKGSAGVDHITVSEFAKELENNLGLIREGLEKQRYKPQQIREVEIPKPGSNEKRKLGIPTVRDRVVQAALLQVIEPIFEKGFSESSYGFRPRRSCKDALRQVVENLRKGYEYVVEADIQKYFDSIPHDKLTRSIKERIADGRVLQLIEQFLKQGVLGLMKEWRDERGTPQGGVISPLLANIYLNDFDHDMDREGYILIRYADDFVVMCRNEGEAERALSRITDWMNKLGLNLHPTKTRIVNMAKRGEGFDFLGYHFERTQRSGKIKRWPSTKSLNKIKVTIRGLTMRCNGHSLEYIIRALNRVLKGWFEYFKHSMGYTFRNLDQWIRMRLRSILRKRRNGHGRGRGLDHIRWMNSYFTEHGLFSLVAAHKALC